MLYYVVFGVLFHVARFEMSHSLVMSSCIVQPCDILSCLMIHCLEFWVFFDVLCTVLCIALSCPVLHCVLYCVALYGLSCGDCFMCYLMIYCHELC